MSNNLTKTALFVITLGMLALSSLITGVQSGCRPMNQKFITKDQAVEKAKQVGQKTYGNIDAFEVKIEEDSTYWKVNFTNPQALERGGAQHFSVWVTKKSGDTRLFKGR